mmetsp:Transcript_20051/g.28807  ORF Transcript_20051/g.28807 Transcript_20051/m.28807 type:complete len:502 (-) Transcript_20051:25-1530(-)
MLAHCIRWNKTLFPRSRILSLRSYQSFDITSENIRTVEEELKSSYNGVQILTSAGVRAVELCRPDKGNYLDLMVINNLLTKLENLKDNWTANAVFVGSRSIHYFSSGIHDDDMFAESPELFQKIQLLASKVEDFPDHLLALYGGYITGTPFAMLLGSHYRLGTPSLSLNVTEPSRGQIPMGGFAFKFCTLSPYGKIVSRYLTFSGAGIHSVELYEMGVLTTLTDHKPHIGMQFGDTIPRNDTQAVQPFQGEPEYLKGLIDDMHIGCDFDVSNHEAWDKFLLVPLQKPEPDPLHPHNIKFIYDDVEHCFSVDTVEEVLQRLEGMANDGKQWAVETLRNISKCDPLALKAFLRLTKEAAAVRSEIESLEKFNEDPARVKELLRTAYHDSLSKELNISGHLVRRQMEAKEKIAQGAPMEEIGWINTEVKKKSDFDLSYYETEEEEAVSNLEDKTLKEIKEEEARQLAEAKKAEEEYQQAIAIFKKRISEISVEKLDDVFSGSEE